MRFLKVVFATVILSFIISIAYSIIGHTPVAEREPNIYYFSMKELFVFSMFYITLFLLAFSTIASISYWIFEKIKQVAPIMKIILSIVCAASIMSIGLLFINKSEETNDIYLIPEGYEGEVYVFYNVKGAPKGETEDGYEVHKINEEGYFVTSEHDMDYGTVTDKYYYVDENGNRTPISDQCVSGFGTGGYSTSENEEVNLVYTGFKLTKDQCSNEFMTENHGMGEGAMNIIHKILAEYYAVEQ